MGLELVNGCKFRVKNYYWVLFMEWNNFTFDFKALLVLESTGLFAGFFGREGVVLRGIPFCDMNKPLYALLESALKFLAAFSTGVNYG